VKDYLRQLVATADNDQSKRSVVREYLQARTLQSLQDSGAFLNWVFHGGTALRFLYAIPRYSEDLDFSLIDPSSDSCFRAALEAANGTFESEGYRLSIKLNDKRIVHSAFLSFQGLLHELGLSTRSSENLSIKVELDTNPPQGAGWDTTLVRRYVTLNLAHHAKPSLLSGKLHAVLARPFVKGRDLYDLVWYLSDPTWPQPNLVLLNNALAQTGWESSKLTERNWKDIVRTRIGQIDWAQASKDVMPFLEREKDIALLTREN
jgi:hypothetical protein